MIDNDVVAKGLADLASRNIKLWSENGKIKYRAAAGVMTQEDVDFLKANRDAVIEYLMNDDAVVIADPERQYEPFGMTEIQQAYILGRNPAFYLGGCACHIYLELEYNSLDPQKAEFAWNRVINRHPMLRAVMSTDGTQRISEHVPEYKIRVVDCGANAAAERANIKSSLDHLVYDTEKWPLFTLLISRGDSKDILHISIEFVTADWSSIWTALSEFEKYYFDSETQLPMLDVTFRDYLTAEKKLRQGSKYWRDREYWMSRIDELPPAPELPIEDTNPPARFERHQFSLTKTQWDNLCRYAGKYGVTPTSAVMTAYGMTLARWSKNKKFCLNLSILNRLALHPRISDIVGDFTASSILQMEHIAKKSFRELSELTMRQLFDDLDHRLFGGVSLLRELRKRRGDALMPYVFTGAIGLIPTEKSRLVGKLNENGISQTAQVYVDCQAMDTADGLNINLDMRVGVFPERVADDLCETLKRLLCELSESEEYWTKPFYIELPAWQRDVMTAVNSTSGNNALNLLHEQTIKRLCESPERFAVADCNGCWTRGELYKRVVSIAALLGERGIGKNDLVGVAIPKSRWQLAACLGILTAGAAYVPLDVKGAPKRAQTILERVSANCVLSISGIPFLTTPTDWIEVDTLPCDERDIDIDCFVNKPDDLAYIIFTSGSTGEPKGVAVSHGAAANTIADVNRLFSVNENDRVFNISQLNFDLSVYDLFGVIAQGGGVIIPDAEQYKNPAHWEEMMNRYKATIWNSVPALMQLYTIYRSYNSTAPIPGLRLIMLSGDWIPPELPTKLSSLFMNSKTISLGGATEGGIWSIYHECDSSYDSMPEWKSIPYGKPLANQGFMIMDSMMQNCPVWVEGELYITGDSLADGYWGETELTRNSFVSINGCRAYRTGDMGRYHPDGNIEFMGRRDSQVKLRGHRIELGEIESVMKQRLKFGDVCCIVYEHDGEKQLAALIADKERIDDDTLSNGLSEWLPDYMIPKAFAYCDAIPLTANGKVDRTAVIKLVETSVNERKSDNVSDFSELSDTQRAVIDIMKGLLNRDKLGVNDDFYEAGANSLLLARAAGQLNQNICRDIPFDTYLVTLLNSPNARGIAELIDSYKNSDSKDETTGNTTPVISETRSDTAYCGNGELMYVVFAEGLDDAIIQYCKNSGSGYILVYNTEKISDTVERALAANAERICFIAADCLLSDCLRAASMAALMGADPDVKLIESERDADLLLDTPYYGDISYALTISDMSDNTELIDMLETVCLGDIRISCCKDRDELVKFITGDIDENK